jgi:pilus assembly protein Flp/PilA
MPAVGKPPGRNMIKSFLRDESGATAIEYGLIAALVAVAIIISVDALGSSLGSLFDGVKTKVNAKMPT